MAYTTECMKHFLPIIEDLPEDIWWDCNHRELSFQARTQEEARRIRSYFKGVTWTRKYNNGFEDDGEIKAQWWEWNAKDGAYNLRIFAIKEAPPTCRAIYEERTVTRAVPVAYEEREVVERVLTGYDCGGEG